jgi:hypothetical protein
MDWWNPDHVLHHGCGTAGFAFWPEYDWEIEEKNQGPAMP